MFERNEISINEVKEEILFYGEHSLIKRRISHCFKTYGISDYDLIKISRVVIYLYEITNKDIAPILVKELNRNNGLFICSEIYNTINALFFDTDKYKWKVRYTLNVLNENHINIESFNILFEYIIRYYYTYKNKGKISSFNFLKKLKEKEENKLIIKELNKIEYLQCIEELRSWKNKYLNISEEEFISFIHQNTNLPYARSTLRRLYFDETIK